MLEPNTVETLSDQKNMNFAMRLSLGVGIFMLVIKTYAFMITGSTAIFSDASESVIHVFAVGFAAYSMWLSFKPADKNHPYGHDKITFFSAGFEGAMIMVAAFIILYEAIHKMIVGIELENLEEGIAFIITATLINLILGFYLVFKGKKYASIILEANGKHILTDSWTSFGVIVALVLVKLTGILWFDPLIAIFTALNILWTGSRLLKKSIGGLMDQADEVTDQKLKAIIQEETHQHQLSYHQVKHRNAGNKIFVEFHLLFPQETSIYDAHEIATKIESKIKEKMGREIEVLTHLEPKEDHDEIHRRHQIDLKTC